MKQEKPKRFYVSTFHSYHPNIKLNEPMRWLKVPANVFSRLGSARSLQTCATFAAILIRCSQEGSHTIEIDSVEIAAILRADTRTIQKAIDWLEAECFIVDTNSELISSESIPETQKTKQGKTTTKIQRKKSEILRMEDCESCGGSGLVQRGSRLVVCVNCDAKNRISTSK